MTGLPGGRGAEEEGAGGGTGGAEDVSGGCWGAMEAAAGGSGGLSVEGGRTAEEGGCTGGFGGTAAEAEAEAADLFPSAASIARSEVATTVLPPCCWGSWAAA
jgi:hypothetical protein